ncbi:MAG: helix-turn-helix transcriptional regulator [Candidatus Peribacteraceae bacterium]|nr:helix-turn-helix transcriptional regulator [Candidatus Peribacteraceae bacterium]
MSKQVALLLGKRLKILRKRQHLTQEELATRAKINVKHLQRLEGKTPCRANIESLQSLADAFEMPLWKLVKFEE